MSQFAEWMQNTFGPSWFAGIKFGDWIRLLAHNRFRVAPRYLPRAAFIATWSIATSAVDLAERAVYGSRVAKTQILPPLFVLGHQRSGTTHLHNLLANDPRFAHPTMYEVNFPHTFMLTERCWSWLMRLAVPDHRPMDNVRVGVEMPQEDEWALCALTQGSPYIGWSFGEAIDDYERYWTLDDLDPRERERWLEQLVWFCRKLQWTHRRPLVLKSPAHTARLRWLLPHFPGAKFVHVHRNPYDVVRSTQRLWKTIRPFCQLQVAKDCSGDDERILRIYRRLHEHYFEDRRQIPQGHLHELRYEDLERRPIETLRGVYEQLGLPDFEEVRPRMEAYLQQNAGYQKNRHAPIDSPLLRRINAECRLTFEEWGYPMQQPPSESSAVAAEPGGIPAAA